MGFTSRDRQRALRQLSQLSEAVNAKVPIGTTIGWATPGGKEYGVVVGSEGKHLLAITAYDKTLVKDRRLKKYRDEALSGKLTPFASSVRLDVQRVPVNKAFKHSRVTGAALRPYTNAAKQFHENRGEEVNFQAVNVTLQSIAETLEDGSDIAEEEMLEMGKAVLHWVKQKHGAAKAAAHRAFVKMVRHNPAAHRRKMRQDKKYHQRHKWHDALMRKTARPGFIRKHIRSHEELPDDLAPLDERDPGQAFMDLPFELRVTERSNPKSMKVQSLIFSKKRFDRDSAVKWAKSHGFQAAKVDEKTNTFRIRQRNPSEFETFRTITFKPGLKAVVAKQ